MKIQTDIMHIVIPKTDTHTHRAQRAWPRAGDSDLSCGILAWWARQGSPKKMRKASVGNRVGRRPDAQEDLQKEQFQSSDCSHPRKAKKTHRSRSHDGAVGHRAGDRNQLHTRQPETAI